MQQQSQSPEIPFDESTIGVPHQLCSVCGDTSTGIHFGGNSCESCKAFFRRSVQCNRYQNYKCSNDERCPVNIVTRKVCQFCRYQKCTRIGMKPKWVLSDQEREEKYGPRRKRFRENRAADEDPEIYKYLSKEEKLLIEDIAHALYQSRATYPLEFSPALRTFLSSFASANPSIDPNVARANAMASAAAGGEKPPNPSANFLIVPIQRLVLFARMLKDFNLFTEDDKVNLLKSSAFEVIVCSSSTLFDPQTQTFTNYISRDQRAMLDGQVIPLDPLLKRLWGEELFQRTKQFLISMCQLDVDEVTTTLLTPVILFSPDRLNINDLELVKRLQAKYASLVLKYMYWRYGVEKAEQIYPKLLLQIVQIRTLSFAHGEIIQKMMSTTSVNPLVQEVTGRSELFSTLSQAPPSMDSQSAATPMDEEKNPPSIDSEMNSPSDDEETARKRSRRSLDDDQSHPKNIWRREEKVESTHENEITNVKQMAENLQKQKPSSSSTSIPSTHSQRRPYDHQVPNFVSSPGEDLSLSNGNRYISGLRHLPPKKQSSIAHRDSIPGSPASVAMSDFSQTSSPAPSTPRQYIDEVAPSPKPDLSTLSLNPSTSTPPPLAAEEQQLLNAIHAHPNKRDLVLNLLRQLNESGSISGLNLNSSEQ